MNRKKQVFFSFPLENNKKAQITLFIILGILLVFLVGLLFLFSPGLKQVRQDLTLPNEMRPIKTYVDECVKTTAINGLSLLGVQGGRIFEKGDEFHANYSNISYGYSQGRNILPSITEMEYDLSGYMGIALQACTNFSLFNKFNITYKNLTVSTKIISNEVIFDVNYLIHAQSPDFEGTLDRFTYTAPIRLGHISQIANSIINQTIQEPDWIDLTYLSDFDVFVSIIPNNDSVFIYSLADNMSSLNGNPYLFLFANNFIVNQKPVLNLPSVIRFQDGVAVSMQLDATDPEDDPLIFSDDTTMFDISEDGVILFIPEVPGSFDVTITVEDDYRNIVSKVVQIIVE